MIDSIVRRLPCLSRVAPGFVVVCSPAGTCVEMGGAAAAIWQAMPGPAEPPVAFAELVAQLAATYGVPFDVLAQDASAVIAAWEVAGCAVRLG